MKVSNIERWPNAYVVHATEQHYKEAQQLVEKIDVLQLEIDAVELYDIEILRELTKTQWDLRVQLGKIATITKITQRK